MLLMKSLEMQIKFIWKLLTVLAYKMMLWNDVCYNVNAPALNIKGSFNYTEAFSLFWIKR